MAALAAEGLSSDAIMGGATANTHPGRAMIELGALDRARLVVHGPGPARMVGVARGRARRRRPVRAREWSGWTLRDSS